MLKKDVLILSAGSRLHSDAVKHLTTVWWHLLNCSIWTSSKVKWRMRCRSQTGSMMSGEEVGGNRRNTKMLGWSPTASLVCFFQQAPLSCTYQPFKRGKQQQHGLLAILMEEEWVDILFHTHTQQAHTRYPHWCKRDEASCQWARK